MFNENAVHVAPPLLHLPLPLHLLHPSSAPRCSPCGCSSRLKLNQI
jgi:hypothetical protein